MSKSERLRWSKPRQWEWREEWGPDPFDYSRPGYWEETEEEPEGKRPPIEADEKSVIDQLGVTVEAVRQMREQLEALGKSLARVKPERAGVFFEPLQQVIVPLAHAAEELIDFEHAAIESVRGRTPEPEDFEAFEALWDAVERRLNPTEQEVFRLWYDPYRTVDQGPYHAPKDYQLPRGSLTQKEIASAVRLTQGRVSQVLKSARQKLKEELGYLP